MSETFIWVPSYGSAVSIKPNVQALKFGDGYEQRVVSGINSMPRQWKVSFANRKIDTATAIENFLASRRAIESFIWTPPHGGIGKWVAREWVAEPTGPFTRTVQATFDEVFEAG